MINYLSIGHLKLADINEKVDMAIITTPIKSATLSKAKK